MITESKVDDFMVPERDNNISHNYKKQALEISEKQKSADSPGKQLIKQTKGFPSMLDSGIEGINLKFHKQ